MCVNPDSPGHGVDLRLSWCAVAVNIGIVGLSLFSSGFRHGPAPTSASVPLFATPDHGLFLVMGTLTSALLQWRGRVS